MSVLLLLPAHERHVQELFLVHVSRGSVTW